MSLERFSHTNPTNFRGLMEYFPPEILEGIQELTRRLDVNQTALVNDLRAQVVVDTSILPTEESGSETTSTTIVATDGDVDDALLKSIMFTM